jgi:hypothetical protein
VEAASHEGASTELAQLRKEERSLSVRRTRLHARIDFLRAGGYAGQSGETLEELEKQEAELSKQRRELHERIERFLAESARSDSAA